MGLARRIEILTGGPDRPFPLSALDADLLADALSLYQADAQKAAEEELAAPEAPDGDWDWREADRRIHAHVEALRVRLLGHAGYAIAPALPVPERRSHRLLERLTGLIDEARR